MAEKLYPALQLTDACNKRCKACLRVPGERTQKRSMETVQRYLEDIKRLANNYHVDFQFVTGGEPTIWKDGDKDAADVIVAFSQSGNIRNITMPTNGKRFEDEMFTEDFFRRIADGVDQAVIVGVSVAGYQENFVNGSCIPLENVLAVAKKVSYKLFPVALVTLSQQDDMCERLKETYPDVIQRVTPLAPLGAGEGMMEECPSFSLSGSEKSSVGSFLPHFMRDVTGKFNISEEAFYAMPNSELMNRLSLFSHCGNSPFVDDAWHYCLPYRENPEYDLARVGDMAETTLSDFLSDKPFLESIRKHGVIETVTMNKDKLTPATREKVDHMFSPEHQVSVAYRGCMVCKEFAEAGVWGDLHEAL